MANIEQSYATIKDILWQSLEGGEHDLQVLEQHLEADSKFDTLGFDSLELVDFFLRLEEYFNISIPQEDYATMDSIESVQDYVENRQK